MTEEQTVHAVVLTGGRSSRMGGRHKPAILVDGHSVIDRTLTALWSAAPDANVVIAGSDEGLSPSRRHQVTVVREHPPFSGPLAGVRAAVESISSSDGLIILLGGDLPFLSARTLQKLLGAAAAGVPLASCVDATGHLQYLCAAWQQDVLRSQLAKIDDPAGIPLKALFDGLHAELVDTDPDELRDIDTPHDLARAMTTKDGRPVPEALLAAIERFDDTHGSSVEPILSPRETAEILDFARDVKYSASSANPVVAAFLAGQLAGSRGDVSVPDALRAVLEFVESGDHFGSSYDTSHHSTGSGDV